MMPITLESRAGMEGSEFVRRIARIEIIDTAEIEERKRIDPSPLTQGESTADSSSSSSSSIGKDSDDFGSQEEGEDGGEGEVQSSYKGPLHGMKSLEESLPIRRGISDFYSGKSKSFTSLSDVAASCGSVKDLAKEENAYTRKRRNLLALKTMLDGPNNMLKSSSGGIMKKSTAAPARCTLAIASAMSSSSKHENRGENALDHPQNGLPPLPRSGKSSAAIAPVDLCSQQFSFSSRSFSLGDLSEMDSFRSSTRPGDRKDF